MAKWIPSPNVLPGSTDVGSELTDTHQFTGSVSVTGSLTLNGSAVSTGGGGGGISWDGSTANGVATFKDADEATVESNLTFDGSTLTVTGDVSASSNISASAFYGDGSNLSNLPAGSPSAPVNSVQFNEASSFGGDAQFTWNTTTQFLAITGTSDATPAVGISGAFYVGGGQGINSDPDGQTAGTGSIGLGHYGYDSGNSEDKYAITLYGINEFHSQVCKLLLL